MTTYKVFGIERKNGEYDGRQYDNIVLHVLENTDLSSDRLVGYKVLNLKLKTAQFEQWLSSYSLTKQSLINQECKIVFNRYGQVDDITLLKK